jgi:uncharacterized coiled-coil DUF342 family protein
MTTFVQLQLMTKKLKERDGTNDATIKHLTKERDETSKQLQSMTNELDELSKQLQSMTKERDETLKQLDETKTKLDEQSDETLNLLSEERDMLAKREATIKSLDETMLELKEMTAKHNATINILMNERDKTKKEHDEDDGAQVSRDGSQRFDQRMHKHVEIALTANSLL